MLRRIAAGGLAATLFLVLLAGCGGPETSASPSASAGAASSAPTVAPSQGTASSAPSAPPASAASSRKLLAACAGVAIRKGPTMTDEVLVRVAKLTKVRVAATVTGDPYQATSCGKSGADWVKIDRINGKSVKKLFGVPFGYAAAGFFE